MTPYSIDLCTSQGSTYPINTSNSASYFILQSNHQEAACLVDSPKVIIGKNLQDILTFKETYTMTTWFYCLFPPYSLFPPHAVLAQPLFLFIIGKEKTS